jgi:predicted transcriptional regulator
MRHRTRFDIISEILDAANERSGAGRTKIMYKAFLSYGQLKEYLAVLTESGLLRYDMDAQTFKTTKKGLRFFNTYNRIGEAMKIPSIRQQQLKMQGRAGL